MPTTHPLPDRRTTLRAPPAKPPQRQPTQPVGLAGGLGLELRLFDRALGGFLPRSAEKSRIIEEQARTIGEQAQSIKAVKAELNAAEARIAELERKLGRIH